MTRARAGSPPAGGGRAGTDPGPAGGRLGRGRRPPTRPAWYRTPADAWLLGACGETTGMPSPCPYATKRRGRSRNARKWPTIEACNGHRADLTSVQCVRSWPTASTRRPMQGGMSGTDRRRSSSSRLGFTVGEHGATFSSGPRGLNQRGSDLAKATVEISATT